MNVTSQLCGPRLITLDNLVNKRRGKDYKVQVARVPAPCSPMPDRHPGDTGTPWVQALGIRYSIVKTARVHF